MDKFTVSEGTKITVGAAAIVLFSVVSVAVSVSVSDARVDVLLENQEKRLDYNRDQREKMQAQLNSIDIRTAKMETILEELRARK